MREEKKDFHLGKFSKRRVPKTIIQKNDFFLSKCTNCTSNAFLDIIQIDGKESLHTY
jgi:hypothetical protein